MTINEQINWKGGNDVIRPLFAIAGIVILDLALLAQGIDGTVTMLCVAAIAGLGGYPISQWLSTFIKKP